MIVLSLERPMDRKVFLSFLLIVLFVALYLIAANGSVWLSDCPWGAIPVRSSSGQILCKADALGK